ncbi:SLC13 family permease [Halopseudomonas xiamenensis]|uniref:SLC13 family permease n=1 Tax=Halopseudomonas xiamenensis TaxID=157792 RepID=UPI001628D2C2|nr:DASS family sodium-coupled anion symporter [Halopseudomonas xiamenensis]
MNNALAVPVRAPRAFSCAQSDGTFRQAVGFILAPLLFLCLYLAPLGLTPAQQAVAASLGAVIVLWVTEALPIPVSGILGIALMSLLGVDTAAVIVRPFGSPIIFLFIGVFILAHAMMKHGLAKRAAFMILDIPGLATTTNRILIAFGLATCLLSFFISNTATVAILLPTALGILGVIRSSLARSGSTAAQKSGPLRLGIALMLILAYGASVGGILTPVATPPNLVARQFLENDLGQSISILGWMLSAAPLAAVLFVVLILVVIALNRPETNRIEGIGEYIKQQRQELGPMSRAEKNTLLAFIFMAVLWLAPSLLKPLLDDSSALYMFLDTRLNEGMVAVLGACLLFMLPTNWNQRQFTLEWKDAAQIDWGTVLLFGSGLIFGSMMGHTGLSQVIGSSAASMFGLSSSIAITIFAVALALVISETTSNTAAAAIIVPIIIPIAIAADVSPLLPAIAGTFACSLGAMLPVATPQNAIVYGSGEVPLGSMIKTGFCFSICSASLVLLILPWTISLMGM